MIFTIQDLNNNILHTGTKQECMHFIKRNKLDRRELTVQTINDKPTPHYTIPIIDEPPKSWIRRIF